MLYRLLLRPILYLLPAETAHRFIVWSLRLAQSLPGVLALLRLLYPRPAGPPVRAFGLDFPTPIGLAAGFDKDAEVYEALGAIGFGFVEVGTITGEGQPGNPEPRLFRLTADRALVNRMGFNNHGAEQAAEHFENAGRSAAARSTSRPIVGINIGKTKLVAAEDARADYEKSARLLAPFADYMVVNVSSPNTPGLRDLQAVESLRPILSDVRRALDETVTTRRVPLLVKIAPDLSEDDVLAVADLSLELGLDGIIATNTTISRAGLESSPEEVDACGAGGLSGAPLRERSLRVLSLLKGRVGDRVTLVSAGGIETVHDAAARLAAGATLVQVYTALVYEGPSLPSQLARGLAKRAAR